MSVALQKRNGPASAPTLPDLGSNNPSEGIDMNVQRHTTAAAGAPDEAAFDALKRLEAQICDIGFMTDILGDMLEQDLVEVDWRTGQTSSCPRPGEFLTVRLTKDQIEKLVFASNDVLSRAKELKRSFYAAVNGEVAS